MAIESREQAEALLKELSAFYKEPVMPIGRYCDALKTWANAVRDKADRKRLELYPNTQFLEEKKDDPAYQGLLEAAWSEYRKDHDVGNLRLVLDAEGKPHAGALFEGVSGFWLKARLEQREITDREREICLLREYEKTAETIGDVFTRIMKSCLLDRLLYMGESLRTQECPKHKGRWSGCAWDDNPCACQQAQDGRGVMSNVCGWLP